VSEGEDLVRRVIDTHNRDPEALLDAYGELFAPDFEFRPMTVGAEGPPYRGRDGFVHYYRERAEAFGGGEVHIRSLETLDDAVVVRARSTALGRLSGASVEEDISLVYWHRDGRVVRLEIFRSHQDALEAAGA
jgi:ketosteroid isomerase-like protein